MELMEVVSPSVAVPVLCVLVCAFFVFAFGFKSPAQPPSFDVFEDDSKKRRSKKTKGSRSQSNGHAVPAGSDSDTTTTSTKPSTSPRQSKQATKSQPSATKPKQSPASPAEAPKKNKKQAIKVEETKPAVKKESREDADVEGWHTVPKKDKKQKKSTGESPRIEKLDSPVKEEIITVKTEAVVEASVEPVPDKPVTPPSPMEQKSKKKKEKKAKKSQAEETVNEAILSDIVYVEKPTDIEAVKIVETAKPKVAEKIVEKIEAASIELQIQDAMETTVEETGAAADKKRNKKKKKSAQVEDDFVIPQSALVPEPVLAEADIEVVQEKLLTEKTDALTVKSPKKKQKKDRSKRPEEKLDTELAGASAGIESSLSQTTVSDKQTTIPKLTKERDNPVHKDVSSAGVTETGDAPAPEGATATFDEMGVLTESWSEAKPKSKKKKARRAD